MQILEVPEAESESEDDTPQPVALRPRPSALGSLDRWSSWDIPSLTLPKAKRQGAGLRIATNPDFSSSKSQVSFNVLCSLHGRSQRFVGTSQELGGTNSLRVPPSARRQVSNPRYVQCSFCT